MKLDGAVRQGNTLIFETKDPDAWRFLIGFKPGDYEIKRKGKKRSLDANAYAWVLIDKIAYVLHLDKKEVYRNELREIGGASEVVCVQDTAVQRMVEIWESQGLGWQVEKFPVKTKGCTGLRLHYGSSVFDTRQMSVFIDHLVQEAKALDIETLSDRELSLLKEGWG